MTSQCALNRVTVIMLALSCEIGIFLVPFVENKGEKLCKDSKAKFLVECISGQTKKIDRTFVGPDLGPICLQRI